LKRGDDSLVAALSEAARHVAASEGSAGPGPAAWHRLQAARQTRGRPAVRRWALPLLATACLALAIGALATRRPRALTYSVRGGQIEANGYVRSGGDAATEVQFSDGTRVHLARGTRMSVGTPGPSGARLRLEDGQAHFEVVHRPGADWSVEAGPYRVQVTGTVFDVRWAGAIESLEIKLSAGSVRITGPQLAEPVTLKPGQRLTASLPQGQLRIDDKRIDDEGESVTAPAPPAAEPPREAPPPLADEPPRPVQVVKAVKAVKVSPIAESVFRPQSWPERVAKGESAAVLAEARSRALDDVIADIDGAALGALADAARYSGERQLASRILLQVRHRFAGTPQAQGAAFLLGRLADDGGDAHAALDWYRRYGAEAQRGPYAAEALGREMLAVERLSGRAAATALAREYLARFPNGTYPLQARSILGLP
jgi:FecR protein